MCENQKLGLGTRLDHHRPTIPGESRIRGGESERASGVGGTSGGKWLASPGVRSDTAVPTSPTMANRSKGRDIQESIDHGT